MDADEQVGLLTCSAGHHSLLLDSRDYWPDVLGEGRPKEISCRCGGRLFTVELFYDFRQDGDVRSVRSVDVLPKCSNCARRHRGASFEINYGPTDELVSKPLDPIEQPWLRAKQRQITAYWQPADAKRFVSYLTGTLGARMYCDVGGIRECEIHTVEFYPELKYDLCFTNIPDVAPPPGRDPQKHAPILRLGDPLHMVVPTGIALLHYIEWAEEILLDMEITRQPQSFLTFAQQAREWLDRNYVTRRGRNTADNPAELVRVACLLRLKKPVDPAKPSSKQSQPGKSTLGPSFRQRISKGHLGPARQRTLDPVR